MLAKSYLGQELVCMCLTMRIIWTKITTEFEAQYCTSSIKTISDTRPRPNEKSHQFSCQVSFTSKNITTAPTEASTSRTGFRNLKPLLPGLDSATLICLKRKQRWSLPSLEMLSLNSPFIIVPKILRIYFLLGEILG